LPSATRRYENLRYDAVLVIPPRTTGVSYEVYRGKELPSGI